MRIASTHLAGSSICAALLLASLPAAAADFQAGFEINGLPPEAALHLNDIPARPSDGVQVSFEINGLPPEAALHLNDIPAGPMDGVQLAFEINGLPPEAALHLNDIPAGPGHDVQLAFEINGLPPEAALHVNDIPMLVADTPVTGTIDFVDHLVAQPGKEQVADTPFGPIVVLARADRTGGNVGIFRTTEPAGSTGASPTRTAAVEVFYVLEGTYRFVAGGKTYQGGSGMTVVIPPNAISRYENIGADEGHLLVWEMPGAVN